MPDCSRWSLSSLEASCPPRSSLLVLIVCSIAAPFFMLAAKKAKMSAAITERLATPVSAAKKVLRKEMRARLKPLGDDELTQQSVAIADRVARLPWFAASKTIGIFLSMPMGELRTEYLLKYAYSRGMRVACPRVMGDGHMEMFEVSSYEETKTLPLSNWKIPEPSPETHKLVEATELDFLVVPAVALDLCRRRCGHGMGFYDRYIQRAKARSADRPPLRAVGVGLKEQREAEVPVDDHDVILDGVVFPDDEAIAPEDQELTQE
eukprot:TRINITY_DN40137_c0_g1_i2.p1 TRINITY_DN40137_c0_g1~~TRINITY_DN40137_c0_g1_i2.p1  ORF type:complete len:264 (+),score=61.20 TRINITY_DN40137_c0_g1_i2:78-869(+)